jgi:hypothetical protein
LVSEVPADQITRVQISEPWLLRLADGTLVAYREFVAALGAAAGQHLAAIGALHAGAKTMGFGALSIVRLKCTFGHGNPYIRVLKQVEKRIGQNVAKDALLLVH